MRFDNLDSRPGRSWNCCPGHGKSWNLMLANMCAAELPTITITVLFPIARNVC